MSEELKACPFCGSEDITIESFGEQRITACCSTCECNTGYMRDNLEAIESWNTRPIEDALRAELELSRKIADEAIKQNEILTEELNVWKPGSITASLMVDELRKQLQDVKDVALRVLNKLNEFDYTESGVNWEIKSGITEIKRIGGMNER